MGSATSRSALGYPLQDVYPCRIPLLFPLLGGPQATPNIYMNVSDWNADCPSCGRHSLDYRGTDFHCCGTTVCSKCTDAVCSYTAETMRIDLRKMLCASGCVLRNVKCPGCKTATDVGFPLNPSFGKRLYDKTSGL
jgi:hypothetical protein